MKKILFGLALLLSSILTEMSIGDTIVGGDITSNTLWRLQDSPFIVNQNVRVGRITTPYPILTIEPGVVLKFNSGISLTVGYTIGASTFFGGLQAAGTVSLPIIFQSSSPTPAPGQWAGVALNAAYIPAGSTEMKFVTIRHATTALNDGGCVPVHHCTFENNSVQGMIGNCTTPGIHYQNSFANNGSGTTNWGMTGTATSPYCWWNAVTGPTTTGGGTAQRVATTIKYEPWLKALPSALQYFTESTLLNRTFNPNIQSKVTVGFKTNQTGNWTLKFINSSSVVVRTITGSGSNVTQQWDGKNDSGVVQPNGTYNFDIDSTATPTGDIATTARGVTIIDTNKALTISSFVGAPQYFNSSTTFTATINYDDPSWTLTIKNSSNVTVRTVTGTGVPFSFVWNGTNDSGGALPDGAYAATLQATVGTATTSATYTVNLDKTLPVAIIHSPTNGQLLSNVYQSGSFTVPVVITATDANIQFWRLTRTSVNVAEQTTNVTNYTAYIENTLGALNGSSINYQLLVMDRAGNSKSVSITVSVGNLDVTVNPPLQLNATLNQMVTYISKVPFPLTQTIFIVNKAGQTVRTLISNVNRPTAGNYTNTWDGRNNSGVIVPDGPYFYMSTININNFTLDVRNIFLTSTGWTAFYPTPPASHDAFKNNPFTVTYTLSQPTNVSFAFGIGSFIGCAPPHFCPVDGEYKESGTHTYVWNGLDPSGNYRTDVKRMASVTHTTKFSRCAVIVFGTKSTIGNVVVTPYVSNPFRGSHSIAFSFTTYQNQPATITVSCMNLNSLSVLRNIVQTGVAPGSFSATWDGKADNGMFVAPGPYKITVSVQDPVGNVLQRDALTVIRY